MLYTGQESEDPINEAMSRGVTEYMQKESDPDHYSVLARRILAAVETNV